jgi:hypothetical protein
MPSSYNIKEIAPEKTKEIGAITIRRTHRTGIYKQFDKTAIKKDQFNDVKTLEITIFLVLRKPWVWIRRDSADPDAKHCLELIWLKSG